MSTCSCKANLETGLTTYGLLMQIRIESWIYLAPFLVACAAGEITRHKASDVDREALSLSLFAEHVMPVLKLCADCHSSAGGGQAPLFADDNAEVAHKAIIEGGKVDFANIPSSRLVLRLTEDNHNCKSDCQGNGEKFVDALTIWKDELEAAVISTGDEGLETERRNPKVKSLLSYDIGELIGDKYADGSIVMEVKFKSMAESENSFIVENLNITTLEYPVYMREIKPLVNGRWKSGDAAFIDVDCAVHASNYPATHKLRDTATTIVLKNDDDAVSFSFAELRIATDNDKVCGRKEGTVGDTAESNKDELSAKREEFTPGISAIFSAQCGGNGCHGAQSNQNTYLTFQQIWPARNVISGRVDNGARPMPPSDSGRSLTPDEKTNLLEWLTE